jgi:ribitol 2-dehydrogenase
MASALRWTDRLRGKVVLITGASTGIGAATARLLAPLGMRLALVARAAGTLQSLATELGPETLALPGDVTVAADVDYMVTATLERFGRIDVLLANAGIYVPGPFHNDDLEPSLRQLEVNVGGVLRIARAVLPFMMAQGSGDLLVTSSISGVQVLPEEPVYCASKFAVQAWAHGLRRQVMGSGVRVMTIGPGTVANELWGVTDPAVISAMVEKRTALTSRDVAEAILFMISRPPHVDVRNLVLLPQNEDL